MKTNIAKYTLMICLPFLLILEGTIKAQNCGIQLDISYNSILEDSIAKNQPVVIDTSLFSNLYYDIVEVIAGSEEFEFYTPYASDNMLIIDLVGIEDKKHINKLTRCLLKEYATPDKNIYLRFWQYPDTNKLNLLYKIQNNGSR